MEKIQYKSRRMHELSFLDTLERGIMDYTPIGVAINAFEGTGKKTKNKYGENAVLSSIVIIFCLVFKNMRLFTLHKRITIIAQIPKLCYY